MADLPQIEALLTSDDPIVLNNDDQEVIRFTYQKYESATIIEIVFRDLRTHAQVGYRFNDVVLKYLPPIQSPYAVVVTNLGRRQYETPRTLAVSVNEDHPDTGILFCAASVERIS